MTKTCIAVLFFFCSLTCFAQSWSGQSSSDARIVPPYRFCVGQDNGQDACFIQTGSMIARLNGQLDFMLAIGTIPLPSAATNTGRIYRVTNGNAVGDCTVGGGTSFGVCISDGTIWQTTGSGGSFTIPNPLTLPNNGSVGAVSVGCSGTDQPVGSGIAWVAPVGCTPYNFIPSPTAGSGFLVGSNSNNKVTHVYQSLIDLTANVVNALPVANGGTGNATASGALINLFPTIIRNGDLICASGSIWTTCPTTGGNTTTPAFLTENSGGAMGWVQVPIPPIDGGTGLTTMTLNTVYKGNTTSGMLPSSAVDNGSVFTVSEPFSAQPMYLVSGTASSQTNECASVTNDSSGSTTVTAVAALRTIVAGVGHDVLCVVTVDAANPTFVGTLVFPLNTSFSPNSAVSQGGTAGIESSGTNGGHVILTNNGGTTRNSALVMRACNGPNATNCGTDLQFIEDSTNTGKEEWEFLPGGSADPFYMGGLGSSHPGIYFGGNVARLNSPFGFDGPSFGHLGHIVRIQSDADMYGSLTLSSGTISYSFNTAYTSAPLCLATWQSGTLTGFLKCATTTSGITITSSVGSDNAVIAYMIMGNNN